VLAGWADHGRSAMITRGWLPPLREVPDGTEPGSKPRNWLLTRHERDVRAAVAELETDYLTRHSELKHELEDASSTASTIREYLLFGTGGHLVNAVRSVSESAGIAVVDLDEKFSGTKNADLLCTLTGRSTACRGEVCGRQCS
jgi:hypothetical protein